MATAFIFHGVGGNPDENWFPWLKKELEGQGMDVIVPAFPHADHPDMDAWLDHFRRYQSVMNQETMFIGHSLGGAFALRLLERMHDPIRAVFLVSSVSGPTGSGFDPLMTTFTVPLYDWKKINRNARGFQVFHSENDPFIPLSQAEELAGRLNTTVELIPGAGHLNASAGYTEFPQLLQSAISASSSGSLLR